MLNFRKKLFIIPILFLVISEKADLKMYITNNFENKNAHPCDIITYTLTLNNTD